MGWLMLRWSDFVSWKVMVGFKVKELTVLYSVDFAAMIK
jgi:hypothetical protein